MSFDAALPPLNDKQVDQLLSNRAEEGLAYRKSGTHVLSISVFLSSSLYDKHVYTDTLRNTAPRNVLIRSSRIGTGYGLSSVYIVLRASRDDEELALADELVRELHVNFPNSWVFTNIEFDSSQYPRVFTLPDATSQPPTVSNLLDMIWDYEETAENPVYNSLQKLDARCVHWYGYSRETEVHTDDSVGKFVVQMEQAAYAKYGVRINEGASIFITREKTDSIVNTVYHYTLNVFTVSELNSYCSQTKFLDSMAYICKNASRYAINVLLIDNSLDQLIELDSDHPLDAYVAGVTGLPGWIVLPRMETDKLALRIQAYIEYYAWYPDPTYVNRSR